MSAYPEPAKSYEDRRGILLKGNGLWDIAPEIWPIALFAAIALTIGVKRYRQTLD